MDKLKPLLPFFPLLVLSVLAILWLFPRAHPYGGIHLPLDADSIVERSRDLLREQKMDDSKLTPEVQLKYNRSLLRQAQQSFGIGKSNAQLRDSIPGHVWDVRWVKKSPLEFGVSAGQSSSKEAEEVVQALKGEIHFLLDTRGGVLEYERKISDSAKGARLGLNEARAIAFGYLKKYSSVASSFGDTAATVLEKKIDQPFRTDYEFNWNAKSNQFGNTFKVKIAIAGDALLNFAVDANVPKEFSTSGSEKVLQISLLVLYFAVGIVMVIVAFRRFRSFEIGFRMATILGIIIGVLFDVEIYLSARGMIGWEILIPLLIVPPFMGGALILVWAVSESIGRETWKEKFVTLDLLSKGHVAHSRIGEAMIKGMVLGVASLAVWLLLVRIADGFTPLWVSHSDDSSIHTFDVSFPWLYALGHSIYANMYLFAFFILFVVSFLRKYLTSSLLALLIASLTLGLLNSGHLYPLPVGIGVQASVGAILIWTFYRYDALASFVGLLTFSALQEAGGLFIVGNPSYAESGFAVIGFFGLLFVGSSMMLYRKNEVTDFDAITPAFVRHITERQRLQQELEIARNVQMSFLPKANPQTYKLDIASRCAPALEVGGDYYDFIELDKHRLGVAVGDVSGKGTQAAFFMTLTKGFLRALARISNSPSSVLTQVNKLFYENVERGIFISMVYGIFDTRNHSLTLARAGHNPVIMRKSKSAQVQVVNPMGLALGLDQGGAFSKSIEEVRITFRPGDVFVFYTDGFPEAMNKTLEEFGEDRLCKTVEKYAGGSASQIMEGVFSDMRLFVGKAKQHDDMTIVVVKIS